MVEEAIKDAPDFSEDFYSISWDYLSWITRDFSYD